MSKVIPIDEAIENLKEEAAEAAVFGDTKLQSELEEKIKSLEDRKDFGEVFYISF